MKSQQKGAIFFGRVAEISSFLKQPAPGLQKNGAAGGPV